MDNYPKRDSSNFMRQEFAGNKIVTVLYDGLNNVDNNSLFLTDGFTSKGSAGNGKWATVPWIALFDNRISNSAKKGFDLVYLFSPDMSRVYLSLNQGWRFYQEKYKQKEGLKNIRKVSYYWQNHLETREDNMSSKDIDLKCDNYKGTNLPLGYERGNILSIRYDRIAIPSVSQLILDLINMKKFLTELERKLLSTNNIDYSISYILKQVNSEKSKKQCKSLVQEQNQNILTKTDEIFETDLPKARLQYSKLAVVSKNNDYNEEHRNNSKLGFIGEKLILQYEKNKLQEAGRTDLSNSVEHVSETQGDGLGYDIKSYTAEGVPLYIEVKTTQRNINTPFYVSINEVKVSEEYSDNYRLVRVYDVNEDKKFYTVNGNLRKKLVLASQLYKALPQMDGE